MYDRSIVCTKQPFSIIILRNDITIISFFLKLFPHFFLKRMTRMVSNFREQSFCDVKVDSVSVMDFCIVCARKKIGCADSRRPCNTTQLPEITFSRRAIRNIAHFCLNTVQFCISMKVQSVSNRIIRPVVHPFLSVDIILQ